MTVSVTMGRGLRRPWFAGLAAVAALCLSVETAIAAGWLSPLVLPAPSGVGRAVVQLVENQGLLDALAQTLAVTLASIGIAIAVGVPTGLLLYRRPDLGRAYESWLAAMFAAPMILLYPLFLVVFGRTFVTVIAMGAITGVIPIILNTRIGLASVPQHLINVGLSFNCTPAQQFRKVLLPAAAPTIFTGIRLGLIYALVNIIGIEFLINFGGLGRLVSEMYDRFDIPAMYAAILFVILISTCIFVTLNWVEQRLRPD